MDARFCMERLWHTEGVHSQSPNLRCAHCQRFQVCAHAHSLTLADSPCLGVAHSPQLVWTLRRAQGWRARPKVAYLFPVQFFGHQLHPEPCLTAGTLPAGKITPGDVTGSVPVWTRPRLSVSASDRTEVNQIDSESMGGKQWFNHVGATTHMTCSKVRKCPNNTVHESTGYRSLGKKEKIRGRKAVSEHVQ
jgi:hypothetical protein